MRNNVFDNLYVSQGISENKASQLFKNPTFTIFSFMQSTSYISCDLCRVPTRPGKPGKMRVHLENLEISWNFEIFNKYHGKIIKTWKNLLTTKNFPLTQILRTQFTMQDYF